MKILLLIWWELVINACPFISFSLHVYMYVWNSGVQIASCCFIDAHNTINNITHQRFFVSFFPFFFLRYTFVRTPDWSFCRWVWIHFIEGCYSCVYFFVCLLLFLYWFSTVLLMKPPKALCVYDCSFVHLD